MAASRPQGLAGPVNWPRMRPRFILEVGCGAEDVMAALRDGAAGEVDAIAAHFSERHGTVTVPEDARQFWSTHLGLTIEDAQPDPAGQERPTRVLGVFSPHPEVWTAYVFAIGVIALIGLMGVLLAVVQLSLGDAPWALLASLITALVGGLVYTSTLVGQSLALGEMYRLRSHLDRCLEDAEERGRRAPVAALDSAQF